MDKVLQVKIDQQRRYVLSLLNEMGFKKVGNKIVTLDVSSSIENWIDRFQTNDFEEGKKQFNRYLKQLPNELKEVFIDDINDMIRDIERSKKGNKKF